MTRDKKVFEAVHRLYAADAAPNMGKWMWQYHVQWVADKAKKLAEKYEANREAAYCAALLHDLADCRYDRDHADFDAWSKEKGAEILLDAGFGKNETAEILEAVRTHSCRPGNLPTKLEGKVLATADAMFHLQTGFYPLLCYMRRPEHAKTYEEWQGWFSGHIKKDFGTKIFFADEKAETRADYEALLRVFGNRTLRSRQT